MQLLRKERTDGGNVCHHDPPERVGEPRTPIGLDEVRRATQAATRTKDQHSREQNSRGLPLALVYGR